MANAECIFVFFFWDKSSFFADALMSIESDIWRAFRGVDDSFADGFCVECCEFFWVDVDMVRCVVPLVLAV